MRLDRPQQDGERVGLVVVGGIETARADRGDDRGLVGIALAGDKALDRAKRAALVGDLVVIAPGGQYRQPPKPVLALQGELILACSPSKPIAVVVLPVATSRAVEMPIGEALNTPSGRPAPEPVRNAFSCDTTNL